MTKINPAAGPYAPLRVVVDANQRGTTIEYDRPSSLFGQFKSAEIERWRNRSISGHLPF
jgi:hypothetical protein